MDARGFGLISALVCAGVATGAVAQSNGWQSASNPDGTFRMQIPASWQPEPASDSGGIIFISGPTDPSGFAFTVHGPPAPGGVSTGSIEAAALTGMEQGGLKADNHETAYVLLSGPTAVTVPGADLAVKAEASFLDDDGTPEHEWDIIAVGSPTVGYSLTLRIPVSYDTSYPYIAQGILGSFQLTQRAAAVAPPSALNNVPAAPPPASAPVTSPATPGPTVAAAPFSDGTYIVGSDIQAGTYRAPGGDSCYWARLSGFDGTTAEILANNEGQTSPIVTIRPSDAGFQTSGCGSWQPTPFGFGGS